MPLTKENFFVMTGGPGGGKSALMKELQRMGYGIVEETARRIIQERMKAGLSPRPSPLDFAIQMFERDVENFRRNLNHSAITFFDRSLMDSAALLREASIENFNRIKGTVETHRFNTKVFITPPWKEIYRTDNERDQTYEDSIVVHDKLFDWYKLYGYDLKVLPKAAVAVRIDFILKELKQI